MAESEEELNSFLMKMKEEGEKAGLKLNIQKIKITASSPNTSWQIDGETMETVTHFIFLGSKITAGGDYSHEIKRRLLDPWKNYDQPKQHVKKQKTSRKTSTSALLTTLKSLTVWITINCGKFFKRWEYQTI